MKSTVTATVSTTPFKIRLTIKPTPDTADLLSYDVMQGKSVVDTMELFIDSDMDLNLEQWVTLRASLGQERSIYLIITRPYPYDEELIAAYIADQLRRELAMLGNARAIIARYEAEQRASYIEQTLAVQNVADLVPLAERLRAQQQACLDTIYREYPALAPNGGEQLLVLKARPVLRFFGNILFYYNSNGLLGARRSYLEGLGEEVADHLVALIERYEIATRARRERREQEAEAIKAQQKAAELNKMKEWAAHHGSEALNMGLEAGYSMTRLYRQERIAKTEHDLGIAPAGVTVDWDDQVETAPKASPSLAALTMLKTLKELLPEAQVGIVWAVKDDGYQDDDYIPGWKREMLEITELFPGAPRLLIASGAMDDDEQ